MTNHPNRNWRSRWRVCLDTQTARHQAGWVFRFAAVDVDGQRVLDGCLVGQPENITYEMALGISRIAREAGDIYRETLDARH